MRRTALAVAVAAVALLASACASDHAPARHAVGGLDGVYRTRTGWTLGLAGHRFAAAHDGPLGCEWAYGGLSVTGHRMELRIVDSAGPAGPGDAAPNDIYEFRWNRYRDVLRLHSVAGATGRELTAAPWRQVTNSGAPRGLDGRCRPPAAALVPTGVEDVTPTGATIGFGGDFVRTGPTTWRARGTSKEIGPGTMRIEGRILFRHELTRSRVTFTVRVKHGVLRGCAIASIIPRPHGRWVWDGAAQVTATSPRLRRYLALSGGIGGVTHLDARDRMHGGFGSYPGSVPNPRSDVVC
jgi:hypothetical protein